MPAKIAENAMIVVSGKSKADLNAPVSHIDWTRIDWDINLHEKSVENLYELMKETKQVIIFLRSGHSKARRAMAKMAKKHGIAPYILTVGKHEEFDFAQEKFEQAFAAKETFEIEIVPLKPNRKNEQGPFDIIGDIHGCFEEMMLLLSKLGHAIPSGGGYSLVAHPEGRRVILLGDLIDRGPKNRKVVDMARKLEAEHNAVIICGNHDDKFARWLQGRNVKIRPGTGIFETIKEYDNMPEADRIELGNWLVTRGDHYVFDDGRLAVAHAGIDEANQGQITNHAREFSLYGPTTGELDKDGFPVTREWELEYKGEAVVVHGHVVHKEPKITGNVVAVDTGAVFGGKLTAFQWPERTFVSVKSLKQYWKGKGKAKLFSAD